MAPLLGEALRTLLTRALTYVPNIFPVIIYKVANKKLVEEVIDPKGCICLQTKAGEPYEV